MSQFRDFKPGDLVSFGGEGVSQNFGVVVGEYTRQISYTLYRVATLDDKGTRCTRLLLERDLLLAIDVVDSKAALEALVAAPASFVEPSKFWQPVEKALEIAMARSKEVGVHQLSLF